MNDNIQKEVITLPPFKRFCMTIGELPSSYVETMTYYEMVLWFTKYLSDTIIPTVNNNAEAVTELQNLFVELQSYVNNYFDNLDVQEEINNKLDEMAEDGTLLELLTNYTQLQKIYNTFEELYNDDTITENAKVKCFGYDEINDGNGGEYLINTTEGIPLGNGLKALLLNNYQENFYNEITYTKERHNETDCYIVNIPLNDNNNNQIDFVVEDHDYSMQSPLQHAQDNLTTLTINAGLAIKNDQDEYVGGIVIGNGEVIQDTSQYGADYVPDWYLYIGIKADRTIQDFKINSTTLEQLQGAGCVNVFGAYFKLLNNYMPVDLTGVTVNGEDTVTTKHPRQVFCEMNDGSVKIFTCDGRTFLNQGLTASELQTILIAKGVKNAWNLDGGGSASTSYKTFKLNRNIDNSGKTDRSISITLNIKKDIINKNIADTYPFLSKLFYMLNTRYQDERIYNHDISNKNLNELIGQLYFGFGTNLTNGPTTSGYFINMTDTLTYDNIYKYNKQIFMPLNTIKVYIREQNNGTWTNWVALNAMTKVYGASYTIQQDSTYEKINLNSSVTSLDGDNVVVNNDNTFSCNYIKNRMIYLTCRFSGSTGAKYVKIRKNGSDVIAQSTYIDSNNPHEIVAISPIIVTATTDKFDIQVYGKQNDTVDQMTINVV